MKAYRFESGPIHLVRLAAGDDLVEAVTSYVTERGIGVATLSYLGAVAKASLRYYEQVEKEYCDFHIHQRLEVLAGIGNVSLLDGKPFVHTHAVFGDTRGRAFGGHVNAGTEVFALEVDIRELRGDAPQREPDDCTGLTLWGGTLEM